MIYVIIFSFAYSYSYRHGKQLVFVKNGWVGVGVGKILIITQLRALIATYLSFIFIILFSLNDAKVSVFFQLCKFFV